MDVELGKLIKGEAERDAIHIAVFPMIAGEMLYPQSRVKIKYGTKNVALDQPSWSGKSIGIVDPFLIQPVREGQGFYCCLYPNTVTGMRHHWQHPKIDIEFKEPSESEYWLREFCDQWNFDFDDLICSSTDREDDWPYITANGIDLHSKEELGEDHSLFWHHLEQYTNQKFDQEHRENFHWSCSC